MLTCNGRALHNPPVYNKIFTKILDSSIWLETDATRLVWLTLIASMDENGFVQFASVRNLAHRTRVSEQAANEAVKILESTDKDSSDPENDGRRIERIPGGWIVLNAAKYRELVTRAVAQEKTRLRVARFREKKANVTVGNAPVTSCTETSRSETPSEALAGSDAASYPIPAAKPLTIADHIYSAYPRKVGRKAALNAIRAALKVKTHEDLMDAVKAYAEAVAAWPAIDRAQFVPHPATWFNRGSYDDDRSTWVRHESTQGRASFA